MALGFWLKALVLLAAGYAALDPHCMRDSASAISAAIGQLRGREMNHLDSTFPPDDRHAAFLAATQAMRADAVARQEAARRNSDHSLGPIGAENVAVFVRASVRWLVDAAGLADLLRTVHRPSVTESQLGRASLPHGTFAVTVPPKKDFATGKTVPVPSAAMLRALDGQVAVEGTPATADVEVTLDLTLRSPKGHMPVIAGPKRATFVLGKKAVMLALERAVRAMAEARQGDAAESGPVVGDSIRVKAAADLCFGAKGFWRWDVLPGEDLVLDVALLAAGHPAPPSPDGSATPAAEGQ